jgi:DNA-binding response OmpR family regulator
MHYPVDIGVHPRPIPRSEIPIPRSEIGKRVALVEEDAYQAEMLGGWLAEAGFLCNRYLCADNLLSAIQEETVDFLVLNWPVAGRSALDILNQVRLEFRSAVPVLLVSARDSEREIVTALRHGADDFMVKPLHRRELLARLEALGRRKASSEAVQPEPIELGALRMDFERRIVSRDSCLIHLTARQFNLAAAFLLNIGRLLSRRELQAAAWTAEQAPSSRTLYAYICTIRARLGLIPPNGWHLTAVHGRGYRLMEVATSPQPVNGEADRLELLRSTCTEPKVAPKIYASKPIPIGSKSDRALELRR